MALNIWNKRKVTLLKLVFMTVMKYLSTMPTIPVKINSLAEESSVVCIGQRISI
jgi:hypothetical protein